MARVDETPRLPEAPRLPPAMPRSGVSAPARLALRQLLGDNERKLADAFRQRADASAFANAADILLRGARGFGHNDFKIGLARRACDAAASAASLARSTVSSLRSSTIIWPPTITECTALPSSLCTT